MIRIILFGDTIGIPQLIKNIPIDNVVAIIGASIRPQYNLVLKNLSKKLGLPFTVQPKWGSLEYNSFKKFVAQINADLIWVHSYSMVIRPDILESVTYGGINLHGALLPKNRGCNPIQWAIINKDFETGVTLHEISEKIDEGPIIDQSRISISFLDSWIDLKHRIDIEIDYLIKSNLPEILSGAWRSIPQKHIESNYCNRRKPEDGQFEWSEPVISIFNKIRALLPPLPPAFYIDSKKQKIEITSFKTIAEVTTMKYREVGGIKLSAGNFEARILNELESDFLESWESIQNLNLSAELTFINLPLKKIVNEFQEIVVFIVDSHIDMQGLAQGVVFNFNLKESSGHLSIFISEKASDSLCRDFVLFLLKYFFDDLMLKKLLLNFNLKKKIPLDFIEKEGWELKKNPTNSNSYFINKE